MARPQKEGLEYFPHDTHTDDKLEVMEAKYGLAGHAFYFKLLERIYRTKDAELDLSDSDTIMTLAHNWHVSSKHFREMLEIALKIGLFSQQLFNDCQRLSSNGIKKRSDRVNADREVNRKYYHNSKLNKVVSDAQNESETTLKVHKGKERKGNSTTTTTAREKNTFEFYQENFGLLTPHLSDTLKDLEKEYSEPWLLSALKEAVTSGVRSLNYVTRILERWKKDGFQSKRSGNGSVPSTSARRPGQRPTNRDDPDHDDPDRFIKGKYGHLVRRGPLPKEVSP